jgi:hypothetical protein
MIVQPSRLRDHGVKLTPAIGNRIDASSSGTRRRLARDRGLVLVDADGIIQSYVAALESGRRGGSPKQSVVTAVLKVPLICSYLDALGGLGSVMRLHRTLSTKRSISAPSMKFDRIVDKTGRTV